MLFIIIVGGFMKKKIHSIAVIVGVIIVIFIAYVLIQVSSFYASANVLKKCSHNMSYIFQALNEYADNHNGQLPPGSEWNDTLISNGFSSDYFVCQQEPIATGLVSNFALNSNLANSKIRELPKDMVLLFECGTGWNKTGQADIAKGHLMKSANIEYVNILFANGNIKHTPKDSVAELRWTRELEGAGKLKTPEENGGCLSN